MDSSILTISVQDTKYRTEGRTTYCDMAVKVNLNSFENQFCQFTQTFIKKVIGEHLPLVETVIDHNYSDLKPVVAKYYLLPGGPAKVLAFDRKYYKHLRKFPEELLLNVGDIIPAKDIILRAGQCVEYDYCQTFTVTGKAVCVDGDTFDPKTGQMIALSKATAKASTRIHNLYKAIHQRCHLMADEIDTGLATAAKRVADVNKSVENLDKMLERRLG